MGKFYHFFFGIKITETDFFVANSFNPQIISFPNTYDGYEEFFSGYKEQLKPALVVLEANREYDNELIDFLASKGCTIHRGSASNIKKFAESFGKKGTADEVNARTICKYGMRKYRTLKIYEPLCKDYEHLRQLICRREDWLEMRRQEAKHYHPTNHDIVNQYTSKLIDQIDKWIKEINEKIEALERKNKDRIERERNYS